MYNINKNEGMIKMHTRLAFSGREEFDAALKRGTINSRGFGYIRNLYLKREPVELTDKSLYSDYIMNEDGLAVMVHTNNYEKIFNRYGKNIVIIWFFLY